MYKIYTRLESLWLYANITVGLNKTKMTEFFQNSLKFYANIVKFMRNACCMPTSQIYELRLASLANGSSQPITKHKFVM